MRPSRLLIPLVSLALFAAGCDRQGEAPPPEQLAEAPTKGADRSHAGEPIPDTEIRNPDDEPASLAEPAGKPMLVNLWASWCAPCVKELPTLEALSRKPGAPEVVLVSQDVGPRTSVDAFLKQHVENLESWQDPKMQLSGALGTQVLPTTIYYDAQGREVWRYIGDLDWTGPEAARLLAEGGGSA